MEWKLKSYEELSKEELYRIIKLRIDVFIVEQNCPYHELDHLDEQAHHLFLSKEGEIAAYIAGCFRAARHTRWHQSAG